jgi:hypothetical protein
MRHRVTPFLFAGLVLASGCGSGGSNYQPKPSKPIDPVALKPGEEATIFPMAEGNQWTYVAELSRQAGNSAAQVDTFDVVFAINKVEDTPNGKRAHVTVTVDQPNSKPDYQVWLLNDKGLYQISVGTGRVPFEPAQPAILFPAETGREFTWKGTGMTPIAAKGTLTTTSKVLAPQLVDAETGRYSAIPVETRGTFATSDAKGLVASTAYWSPGVGLVRFRQEIAINQVIAIQTLRLKAKAIR